MSDKFDELAKGMAQSVTRRGALKKFGLGLASAVIACLGVANQGRARGNNSACSHWHCANGTGDWDAYVCAPHRPRVPKNSNSTCVLIGPADCAYCNYQCC